MKYSPNVAAVYNPTTGEYKEFSKPVNMQTANATAEQMMAKNPQEPRRPNMGWSNTATFSTTGNELTENTGNLNPTKGGKLAPYPVKKTDLSGLYIGVGVLALILFLNR